MSKKTEDYTVNWTTVVEAASESEAARKAIKELESQLEEDELCVGVQGLMDAKRKHIVVDRAPTENCMHLVLHLTSPEVPWFDKLERWLKKRDPRARISREHWVEIPSDDEIQRANELSIEGNPIDDEPVAIREEGGVWIQSWTFVPNEEI